MIQGYQSALDHIAIAVTISMRSSIESPRDDKS